MNKSKKIKQLKREVKTLKAALSKMSDDVIRETEEFVESAHSWSEEPSLGELEGELAALEDHPIHTDDVARAQSGF